MKPLPAKLRSLVAGVCFALLSTEVSAAESRNRIQAENQPPGTTDWLLTKIKKGTTPPRHAPPDENYDRGWRRRKELEGFCSQPSIRTGETLTVFVNTDPAIKFKADIVAPGER